MDATPFHQTFHEIVAEQLRRAPWLLLSLIAHGILLLILFMIPAAPPAPEPLVARVEVPPQDEVLLPEPEPEVVPQPETPQDEPVLTEAEVTDAQQIADVDSFEVDAVESPASSDSWNFALGLGGGAPSKFGGRRSGRAGTGRLTSQTIEAGLKWLRDHQDEDGKWDCDDFMKHDQGAPCDGPGDPLHDVGITGLALLAFLGDGSTLRSGPHQDVIKNGIAWLREQQDDRDGLIGARTSHHFIYDHAIATLALCEAYGLSKYRSLKPYAQAAINQLEAHRNPYGCWRYQPRSGDDDVSITGWAVLALISARDFGLDIDRKALEFADSYLDEMTDAAGRTGYCEKGGFSSRHKGQHELDFPVDHTECMTAVSLLCKSFLDGALGKDPQTRAGVDTSRIRQQIAILSRKPPRWEEGKGGSSVDHYYWYYGTYAMYQAGGKPWQAWEKTLNAAVVKKQRGDGCFEGSWDPVGAWGRDGGRVYSTAILVLTLEAYYRYARVLGGR